MPAPACVAQEMVLDGIQEPLPQSGLDSEV